MKIAIAQINLKVGDFKSNQLKIIEYIEKAKSAKADAVIFPELTVTGYPPEDLLLKRKFIKDNISYLKEIAGATSGISVILGFVDESKNFLYNAAALIKDKKINGIYRKMILPNYGVFDEKRYFKSGEKALVVSIDGIKAGINICEDLWYADGPIKDQVKKGAKILFVLNASPYHENKIKEREKILVEKAKRFKINIIYANLIGGQDELVFDGYSMAIDAKGKIIARAEGFKEELLIADIPIGKKTAKIHKNKIAGLLSEKEEVYSALKLGLKDYVYKNGFNEVVIGLSGGIDSALVAAIAVDALGKDKVHGIFMPSQYTSDESREDAESLAKNLGISLWNISIKEIFEIYLKTMEKHFNKLPVDITEENIQARIRGNIMMALSNKFNWLVLTTGNKSEMSTGYATLYGDMAGGLAVIKDVPKTLVYELAKFRNEKSQVISERILTKEPTAELRPNQKDTDSLPNYNILDPILKLYIEKDIEAEKIISKGFDKQTVCKVLNLVDKNEYKRRQSPPGIKITPKAFGRDRRMPITNKYADKQD
ncbi:MAG: NAD+ synthase [Elusimicrobia bacterium]|nr:NAD+ synthase [Elusimicrobiota bacterium]